MTEVLLGDRVRWECIDGTVRGEVVAFIERTMFGETWTRMEIELPDGRLQELGMKPEYLEMMKFKVIFRDGGWRKMQAMEAA